MPRFAAAASTVVISQRSSEENIVKHSHKQKDERLVHGMGRKNTLPFQNEVKEFYDMKSQQMFWAFLIVLNFFISAVDSQVLPEKNNIAVAISIFMACEIFFAYVFLFELMVNFYGNFFFEFWKSAWNIFDFMIVFISLLALYFDGLPGISVLRLFRAFRAVRLFKRIKSMRKMMDSIMHSVPGMAIAFLALILIMGIYAIVGVNFWRSDFPDEFGDFLKAILSLFQVMTFDSWCSGIARTIIFKYGALPAFYFVSYVFVAAIVMSNVLISLLLDKFIQLETLEDESELEVIEKYDDFSVAKPQRLPDLPEDRAVLLSYTDSISDSGIIEGDTSPQSGSDKLAKSPLDGEHEWQHEETEQQGIESKSQREQPTKIHERKRIKTERTESIELVFLGHIKTSKELIGPATSRLNDEWQVKVEKDIANLMQTVNILNTRLDGMTSKIDTIYNNLVEVLSTENTGQKFSFTLKLSGVEI